jgi:1-acyl-sn-glycerol-3-phosphate acyltransferase
MFSRASTTLRSLAFYAGYSVATILISLICITVFWFIPLRRRFFIYSLWCKFVLFWLRVTCGVRYDVQGLEHIPSTPVVALSTHQSAWETIFLYYALSPVCPILKKELLKIPFWGWAMHLQKPIAIDRSKPREAGRSLLVQGKQRLAEGLSVVIFPEGSRSPAGTVNAFSRGGAKLAVFANAPALPVIHNAGYCWPAHTIMKKPGVIRIRFGPVIETDTKTAAEVADIYTEWVERNKDVISDGSK